MIKDGKVNYAILTFIYFIDIQFTKVDCFLFHNIPEIYEELD